MALYGGQRDVSLIRSLNKEMLHRLIDTEVLYYKLDLSGTATNIYDESDSRTYQRPFLIPSIVNLEDQIFADDAYIDVNQAATFAFLRDDFVTADSVPQPGDIIEYKSRFFEIDGIVENQAVVGKDPDSWFGGTSHGYNISYICQAHMSRQSKLNIVQTRFGNSVSTTNNTTLPLNV